MKLHVFYNGTDSNYNDDFIKQGRFIHGEIVSRFGFYTRAVNQQQANVLRIHGVGLSKVDGNPITDYTGRFFGVRMRDDVQDIVNFVMNARVNLKISNQQAQNGQADNDLVVTLMGWSRGGIGCIYAAHMLAKIWDKIEENDPSDINIDIKLIVFDPVSGLGTNMRALDLGWIDVTLMAGNLWLSHYTGNLNKTIVSSLNTMCENSINWWELPEHVSQFHGFYAHDERSVGFAPTIPAMTGNVAGRNFNIYGVPGTHSTLVGNLYPNGGDTAAGNGAASSVGLHVYRSVVKKVGELMRGWNVAFDNSINQQWLEPLDLGNDFSLGVIVAPSPEALAAYKNQAQLVALTPAVFNPLNQRSTMGLTDGRGVYIGGNKQDRKWKPESTMVEFMNEDNSKSKVDSVWQIIVGSETKLQKLGGNVAAHNYNLAGSNWI
ncbi:hypothetical protein A9Q99_10150 [Gammaproteobacteria bacterium 45_16_T64]|nr:hypothetical protein A9Q99_10150 [Gammaproteobacteria bacterium 45_16_T64]